MLFRQNTGRGHDSRLHTVGNGNRAGQGGDDGLTATNIPLEEPVHRHILGNVAADIVNGPPLSPR